MTPVTIDYVTTGYGFWQSSVPIYVAQQKGFFAEQGITVNTVAVQSSAAGCQSLIAKAVQFGGCSTNDMIQVDIQANFPLIEVAAQTSTAFSYHMLASPSVKQWTDLKGKTIIIGGPKDNTLYYTRVMARANGLNDSDYDFQYAGSSGARLAALQSGAVAAAILGNPFNFTAVAAGYTDLGVLVPDYLDASKYAGTGDVVLREYAEAHPDIVVRWIRAEHNAIEWIYDPANKDDLFAVTAENFKLDRPTFDALYDQDIANGDTWRDQRISATGIQGILDSLVELELISEPAPDPNKFFDMKWLDMALGSN